MPDKIEHIEIAVGTYPFVREGKIAFEATKLIFVETFDGVDNKDDYYTKFDLDTLVDLTNAMLADKDVTFKKKGGTKTDRDIVNRKDKKATRKPKFNQFEEYTVS